MRRRKGHRFSHDLFLRWESKGRGLGRGAEYQPLHQVRRSDPSSQGQSFLQPFGPVRGRLLHLLSQGERLALLQLWGLEGLFDCLEQFPLALDQHDHACLRYSNAFGTGRYAGTREIAEKLGVKHPRVLHEGHYVPSWRMSTDLVAIFHLEGRWSARAISVKPDKKLASRAREKLDIERAYWERQGVQWQLLTTDSITYKTRMAMLAIADQILPDLPPDAACRELMRSALASPLCTSLADAIERLACAFEVDHQSAQRLFWQAVWLKLIPDTLKSGFVGALISGLVSTEGLLSVKAPRSEASQ